MMSKLDQIMFELFDEEGSAIGDDVLFTECAGFDSLKHVELIVTIEGRFGIELTAEEIERLTSKRAARQILEARRLDV
jgi:acyl carrier protein